MPGCWLDEEVDEARPGYFHPVDDLVGIRKIVQDLGGNLPRAAAQLARQRKRDIGGKIAVLRQTGNLQVDGDSLRRSSHNRRGQRQDSVSEHFREPVPNPGHNGSYLLRLRLRVTVYIPTAPARASLCFQNCWVTRRCQRSDAGG